MRYAEGESLTKEELEALRRATIEYARMDEGIDKEEGGAVLKPSSNYNSSSGFTNQKFIIYYALLVIIMSVLLGVLIFNLM